MSRRSIKKSSFKAGMYLLETLTAGMYNEPMSIYREYIQNAVDSIDLASSRKNRRSLKVHITLDPIKRTIKIHDNGFGVPAKIAEKTLSNIGSSDKTGAGMRGFRGIGRLGGIAFSDKTIYRTKAKGEKTASVQVWDCKELRELLSDPKKSSISLQSVFNRITDFYQENSKRSSDSYFEVNMEGVSSFRSYNLDIHKVRNYLSQVAPVPFHPEDFSYAEMITNYLSENINSYGRYEIILNGEPIYKLYRDKVKVTKKGYDHIDDIKFFEINVKGKPISFGWYGQRRELIGAIAKGDPFSGIRIRVGDILLGDAHLLDGCFREPRFNSYLIGEIHVDHPQLIPNSRRDDFVDNEVKTLFYNAVEKKIGLPLSKEIRLRSRTYSNTKKSPTEQLLLNPCQKQSSLLPDTQKEHSLPPNHLPKNTPINNIINQLMRVCKNCQNLQTIIHSLTSG